MRRPHPGLSAPTVFAPASTPERAALATVDETEVSISMERIIGGPVIAVAVDPVLRLSVLPGTPASG
jgi:hypothetical protein